MVHRVDGDRNGLARGEIERDRIFAGGRRQLAAGVGFSLNEHLQAHRRVRRDVNSRLDSRGDCRPGKPLNREEASAENVHVGVGGSESVVRRQAASRRLRSGASIDQESDRPGVGDRHVAAVVQCFDRDVPRGPGCDRGGGIDNDLKLRGGQRDDKVVPVAGGPNRLRVAGAVQRSRFGPVPLAGDPNVGSSVTPVQRPRRVEPFLGGAGERGLRERSPAGGIEVIVFSPRRLAGWRIVEAQGNLHFLKSRRPGVRSRPSQVGWVLLHIPVDREGDGRNRGVGVEHKRRRCGNDVHVARNVYRPGVDAVGSDVDQISRVESVRPVGPGGGTCGHKHVFRGRREVRLVEIMSGTSRNLGNGELHLGYSGRIQVRIGGCSGDVGERLDDGVSVIVRWLCDRRLRGRGVYGERDRAVGGFEVPGVVGGPGLRVIFVVQEPCGRQGSRLRPGVVRQNLRSHRGA